MLLFLKSIFKERIWGSKYFKEVLNYPLDDNLYGEMWSVAAHKEGNNIIIDGPFKGKTLTEVYNENRDLFGTDDEEFPLMVKLIHTDADLSVQVHPDDKYARKHENQYGKAECWYFADEPKNPIVLGHKAKTKEEIRSAIEQGTLTELLNSVQVKKDDFVFIETKTVHALTAGLLVVEIQQSSDVTYRLYDYNRKDKNGNLRPLHVDKSLDVIQVPDSGVHEVKNYSDLKDFEQIVDHEKFSCMLYNIEDRLDIYMDEDTFQIVTVISGEFEVEGHKLGIGESFIILNDTEELHLVGKGRLIISRP